MTTAIASVRAVMATRRTLQRCTGRWTLGCELAELPHEIAAVFVEALAELGRHRNSLRGGKRLANVAGVELSAARS